jgi:hypothetical protein
MVNAETAKLRRKSCEPTAFRSKPYFTPTIQPRHSLTLQPDEFSPIFTFIGFLSYYPEIHLRFGEDYAGSKYAVGGDCAFY